MAFPFVPLGSPTTAHAKRPHVKHKKKKKKKMKVSGGSAASVYNFADDALSGEVLSPARMGATPGGAQDIASARDRVKAGEVPHPNSFTPEGLFSEHDLPLGTSTRRAKCTQTLCIGGEAVGANLLAQPEIEHLAQLGFESGLDPRTWKRAPLNLVVVVDRSGSMSGQPLELVRKSLHEVTRKHLRQGDQLAIVGYHSVAHVVLPATPVGQRAAISRAIDQLQSAGATAMEDGLKLGFEVARRSAKQFKGTTRVMLFTDERPNVGRTDAGSFMGMARAASRQGIGLTTIGVSTHFGAELAQKISSVRGGNLFFFPDAPKMEDKFRESFDTMVTELAYGLRLKITPAKGTKIAGVYGIPGSALQWKGDSIELEVETIFLSRSKGAIYLGFAPASTSNLPVQRPPIGTAVGTVGLSYTDTAGKTHWQSVPLTLVHDSRAGLGLKRGRLLVDQATALKKATALHHESNDQEGAYRLVHALATNYRRANDRTLEDERALVFKLEETLARLSGHAGEQPIAPAHIDSVTGLPTRAPAVRATSYVAPKRHSFNVDHLTP